MCRTIRDEMRDAPALGGRDARDGMTSQVVGNDDAACDVPLNADVGTGGSSLLNSRFAIGPVLRNPFAAGAHSAQKTSRSSDEHRAIRLV